MKNFVCTGICWLIVIAINPPSCNSFATPTIDKTSCSIVTGGNGFVGRAIIQELRLYDDEQYIVSLVRPEKVADEEVYWKNVCEIDSKSFVHVLPYEMLDNGVSLQNVLEKTDSSTKRCVYHVASVFGPTIDHQQTALDNVKGTEDMVRILANNNDNIRLVLTSSMAAVRGSGQLPTNGMYYTHDDWNTVSQLGANWGESYQWSKAESEKRAWYLSKELNVPMTVICPSFVFGPVSSKSSSYSLNLVKQWISGESPVQSRLFVDIRDCAKAHVEAGKRDHTVGKRYILSTECRSSSKIIAEWLCIAGTDCSNTFDPDKVKFDATFTGGAIQIGEKEVETTSRLKHDLGITLREVQDTIVDMTKSLLDAREI